MVGMAHHIWWGVDRMIGLLILIMVIVAPDSFNALVQSDLKWLVMGMIMMEMFIFWTREDS